MAIQGIGSPRATASPLAAARQERLIGTIKYRGQKINYQIVPYTLDHFTGLGFNPRTFREGAHILLLDQNNYARFSAACEVNKAEGIYPLAFNGDQDAVFNDQLPVLPIRSRNIVLPTEHSRIALAHETLHDIFAGGGLSPQERFEFTRELSFWYKITLAKNNLPDQHKNRPFFEEVAKVCAQQYNLSAVPPEYYLGRPWLERGFKIFASECFAYAGEALLLPEETKFRQVPEPLVRFLKFIRVIDPRAIPAGS